MSNVFNFEAEHADQYGLAEAVVLYHIRYWIEQNHINNRNRKDGKTWTYQSRKSMTIHFSFFSVDQLNRIFTKLTSESGPLCAANYNSTGYDRTTWYAFKDEKMWIRERYQQSLCEIADSNPQPIMRNRIMETAMSQNPKCEVAAPIPKDKTDIKTTTTTPTPSTLKDQKKKLMLLKFGESLADRIWDGVWDELMSMDKSSVTSIDGLLPKIVEKHLLFSEKPFKPVVDEGERDKRILRHYNQSLEKLSDHPNVQISKTCLWIDKTPISYDCSDEDWLEILKSLFDQKGE